MDERNKQLAIQELKLTSLVGTIDCVDPYKLRIVTLGSENVRSHSKRSHLSAIVSRPQAKSNKICSTGDVCVQI